MKRFFAWITALLMLLSCLQQHTDKHCGSFPASIYF